MHKETVINRTDTSLCPPEVHNHMRGINNKQVFTQIIH